MYYAASPAPAVYAINNKICILPLVISMAVIRRPTPVLPVKTLPPIAAIVTLLHVLIFYLATVTDDVASIVNDSQNKPSLRSYVVHKQQHRRKALHDFCQFCLRLRPQQRAQTCPTNT